MQLHPIRDRIVVKRSEEMKKTEFGLYIPDSSTEKPDRGLVIAVGTGKVKQDGTILPMEVKVGSTVIFARNAGQMVKIDNEDFLIMTEADVLASVS